MRISKQGYPSEQQGVNDLNLYYIKNKARFTLHSLNHSYPGVLEAKVDSLYADNTGAALTPLLLTK